MAEVKILREGYFKWDKDKLFSDCTITLIKGEKTIIVDTGGRDTDKDLLDALKRENLKPDDISIVINTHNHPDHVWNNFLFKNASIIEAGVSYTSKKCFKESEKLTISKDVELIHTPGHTPEDYTVLVKTKDGLIAVVGDLIMNEKTLKTGDTYFSSDSNLQKENQIKTLKRVKYIIPGHGPMFKSPFFGKVKE